MARMRPVVLLMVVVLVGQLGCAATGPDERLGARLDPILGREAGSGAVFYARVIELPSRRELYARRAEEACTPASNYKLLTSATGLDLFGTKAKFQTFLMMHGDDLWIIGTGDPGTGDYRIAKARGGTPVTMLQEWAGELDRRGIRKIKGDLVYYDGAFERQPLVHPTWPKGWLLHWYAAPVTGLNFNDNSVDITVHPTEEGKPARYEVMPPVQDIKVTNECITGARRSPSIVKRQGGNIYRLGGGCEKKTDLMSKPVDDPGAFFADAFRTQLAAKGITVAGRIRRADEPVSAPPAEVIAVHETSIKDVLCRINKNSQNMFAECMCKLNGMKYEEQQGRTVPGSWEGGGQALRAFLKKNRIDDSKLQAMDGSGLSPRNKLTTRILTEVLAVMFARPDGEFFRDTLTICGVDGSLKDRMKDLKGRVFGKTGYIGGVSSTTGYIQTHGGKWLAFSFIYNNCPAGRGPDENALPYTKLMDEACEVLADWPKIPATQAAAAD